MEADHMTTTPEQAQTDTFAVFRQMRGEPNMDLIAHVEVPRHSQPNDGGVELSTDQRLALAVARAVEREDTFIESIYDRGVEVRPPGYEELEGEEFFVSTEVGKMVPVEYEQNPAFEGVWNPETGGDA